MLLAASPFQRVTMMLSGSECDSFSRDIETALQTVPGVRLLDGQSVPGHLLIDIDSEQVTADELVREVAELRGSTGQTACRASVMQSCITAGVVPVAVQ
jgi:copper chaperone CopZ